MYQKICVICNKEYSTTILNTKTCSVECRNIFRKIRDRNYWYKKGRYNKPQEIKKNCIICDKEIITKKKNKITCSKNCKKEYNKRRTYKYFKLNPIKLKEINKRYKDKNKTTLSLKKKEKRLKNIKEIRKREKEYRLKNLIKIHKHEKKWRINNKKKKNHINSKRKENIKENISLECISERFIIFNNKCCYCNSNDKLSIEHLIPISKKGLNIKNNIFGSCRKCNSSKSNKPFVEWYREQEFYNPEREYQILNYSLAG